MNTESSCFSFWAFSLLTLNEETLEGVFSLLLYTFMMIFVNIPLSNFSTIPSISKLKILSCMENTMQTATSLKEEVEQWRLPGALRYEKPLFLRGWLRQCVCYFHSEKCLFKLRGGNIHKKYLVTLSKALVCFDLFHLRLQVYEAYA